MPIQLTKKCPDCGHYDIYRIHRIWYMRLIPFTKLYRCMICRSNFAVNFWAAIILMSIILPLKLFISILWHLSGLCLLWQKMNPPVSSSEEESWRVLNQFQ